MHFWTLFALCVFAGAAAFSGYCPRWLELIAGAFFFLFMFLALEELHFLRTRDDEDNHGW